MEDLLSLDDPVLDDVFQYSKPNIRRIPVHVWLRLKNHISNFIVDVDGCLVWYHKQLRQAAKTRFIDFEGGRYAKRAYFDNGKVFRQPCTERCVQITNIATLPRDS